ncbi:hypothetical protein Micbo1qcDRAFT_1923 [Microdochium bolleyi]|uniref:Uncharacterized protein n=1 Tax=Microdochium bolleyi TaxID=196109 RepID=A0A136JHJ6_9PEZI|nr:hypothetical protein Micbo1qcDRAFT_1923 [Microdochium bolleyi]
MVLRHGEHTSGWSYTAEYLPRRIARWITSARGCGMVGWDGDCQLRYFFLPDHCAFGDFPESKDRRLRYCRSTLDAPIEVWLMCCLFVLVGKEQQTCDSNHRRGG